MSPPDSGDISQAELRRWLTRIENQQNQMVTTGVWALQQQHMQQQLTDMKTEIASMKSDMKSELATNLADMKLQNQQQAQQKGASQLQVRVAMLSAVLSLAVGVILLVWSR